MKTVKATCSNCGIEFEKRKADFDRTERRGLRHFCCRRCFIIRSNKEHPRGDVRRFGDKKGRVLDEYSPFRWFMIRARQRRERQGETDLSLEWLKLLWEKQNGVCPLTGWTLTLPGVNGWKSLENRCKRASLDRVDCDQGYIKGNVRFISVMANFARHDFTDGELTDFCKAVVSKSVSSPPSPPFESIWRRQLNALTIIADNGTIPD